MQRAPHTTRPAAQLSTPKDAIDTKDTKGGPAPELVDRQVTRLHPTHSSWAGPSSLDPPRCRGYSLHYPVSTFPPGPSLSDRGRARPEPNLLGPDARYARLSGPGTTAPLNRRRQGTVDTSRHPPTPDVDRRLPYTPTESTPTSSASSVPDTPRLTRQFRPRPSPRVPGVRLPPSSPAGSERGVRRSGLLHRPAPYETSTRHDPARLPLVYHRSECKVGSRSTRDGAGDPRRPPSVEERAPTSTRPEGVPPPTTCATLYGRSPVGEAGTRRS